MSLSRERGTPTPGFSGTVLKRVAVVGCSGAGKSRLSVLLGERFGLPVVHLDAHYWRPGWTETPEDEWERIQAGLVASDAWVMDGSFHGTIHLRLARADAFVFLDFPRRTCLRGVLGRWFRLRGTVRPDTAPGCPEKIDLEFLRWVWGYRRNIRPAVLAALRGFEERGGAVHVLRSRAKVGGFLGRVERQ